MREYSYGPWIKHDGKGMPVDGDTLVCVRFPDGFGKVWEETPMQAYGWDFLPDQWSNWVRQSDDDNSVISEYLIVTEVKP